MNPRKQAVSTGSGSDRVFSNQTQKCGCGIGYINLVATRSLPLPVLTPIKHGLTRESLKKQPITFRGVVSGVVRLAAPPPSPGRHRQSIANRRLSMDLEKMSRKGL